MIESNSWYSRYFRRKRRKSLDLRPDYVAKFDGQGVQYFSKSDGLNKVGNLHESAGGTICLEDDFKVFLYNGKRRSSSAC